MSLIVVDVEADGPSPADHSMVCFGAVLVKDLDTYFYGETGPISDKWVPEALAVSGISRKEHESFQSPIITIARFLSWLKEVGEGRHTFISDNPAFDWQWINYYFYKYCNHESFRNPFGSSARRIGDLYCGMKMDGRKNQEWKRKLRKTKHTHSPVDDARGNAEAILAMKEMGLKIKL